MWSRFRLLEGVLIFFLVLGSSADEEERTAATDCNDRNIKNCENGHPCTDYEITNVTAAWSYHQYKVENNVIRNRCPEMSESFRIYYEGRLDTCECSCDSNSDWKLTCRAAINDWHLTEELIDNGNHFACDSFVLLPGTAVWSGTLQTILYFVMLMWLFMGIAIIADVFMMAIEVITSKKRTIKREDTEIEVLQWNRTVANLTLLALGSSAPEILLATIETAGALATPLPPAGELGPSTIVGSAAFNLLCISSICVCCIKGKDKDNLRPAKGFRNIDDMGVFYITAVCSVWAYIWLAIVLMVWTPNVVTVEEGILTLIQFPILVIAAYAQDAGKFESCMGKRKAKLKGTEKLQFIEVKNAMREVAKEKAKESDEKDQDLTPEQRQQKKTDLMNAMIEEGMNQPQKMSRAMYRINASHAMQGKREIIATEPYTVSEEDWKLEDKKKPPCILSFKEQKLNCLESCGEVEVSIIRSGNTKVACSVTVKTIEGSALCNGDKKDFIGIEPNTRLEFAENETEKKVKIGIVDDDDPRQDAMIFKVHLEYPSIDSKNAIGSEDGNEISEVVAVGLLSDVCEVTIVDDDHVGQVSFSKPKYSCHEEDGVVSILLQRTRGAKGQLKCKISTLSGEGESGADAEEDFEDIKDREVVFEDKELSKTVDIKIVNDLRYEPDEDFYVILTADEKGLLDAGGTERKEENEVKELRATVTIKSDGQVQETIDKVFEILKERDSRLDAVFDHSWGSQFREALELGADLDEYGKRIEPGYMVYILHFFGLFWKVLFAFVPPTTIAGGWLTFGVALVFIGGMTAIVAEFATLLGCSLGIPNPVTAITFVALGTSLPDTFASKTAAEQDPDADMSIGNVTGSNSVNVFLGLGIPWVMASCYAASTNQTYRAPAGALGFGVSVFIVEAIICLSCLMWRQGKGGMLGGAPGTLSQKLKIPTGCFFVGMWFLYVILASMKATDNI